MQVGKFCHYFGPSYECINFIDSNKFEYRFPSCERIDEGEGVYQLKKNKLILFFTSAKVGEKREKTKIDTLTAKTDSTSVDIFVYDDDTKKTLKDVTMSWFKSSQKDKAKRYGVITDTNGHCEIKFPKSTIYSLLKPFH